MNEMITIKEAAKITGFSPRTIRKMCLEGEIQEAVNPSGQMWLIPKEWADERIQESDEDLAGFVSVKEAAAKAGVSVLTMRRAAECGGVTAKRREINERGKWLINVEDDTFKLYISQFEHRTDKERIDIMRIHLTRSARVNSIWDIIPHEYISEAGVYHHRPNSPEDVIMVQSHDLIDLIKADEATDHEIGVFRLNVDDWKKNQNELIEFLAKNEEYLEAAQSIKEGVEVFISDFIDPAEKAIAGEN